MRALRWLIVATVAAAAGCGGSPDADPEPRPTPTPKPENAAVNDAASAALAAKLDLLAGLERRTLENGLTVLVKEDRRLPIATTVLSYRVGSVHEVAPATGLAHFLEHMMFKGTSVLKKGDIDAATFESGGFNNAYTTNDFTSYWFTVHSSQLDRFLAIEADRMRNCVLDRTEWESELRVVMEELNRGLDRPWGRLLHELEPAVFKESSYHHPVIGFRKDLEGMKHEDMVAFYRDYYGPNNATLVVVGDVEKEKVFARVKELFGPIARVKEAVPAKLPEPPQDGERRLSFDADKSLGRLALAWRSDRVGSDADIRLDVLSQVLSNGQDSRLHKRLVIKDRSCSSAMAMNDSRRHDGVFTVLAELQEKSDPAAVEAAILEELAKLQAGELAPRELRKAKNQIASAFVFAKEQQYNLADDIGKFEAFGQPDYLKTYLARVEAVTAAQLKELAASLFTVRNRTSVVARARSDRKAFRTEPVDGGDDLEFGEYHEFRLPNGLTLLVKPVRNLPVVSVQAWLDSGVLVEDPAKAGVAALTGRLLDQGVAPPGGTPRTAEEIAELVEFTGSQLSTSATGVSFKALSTHQQLAFDMVRDCLLYPTFPADKLSDHKQLQLSDIKARADAPELVAQELFAGAIYGTHPLGRPADGTEASVAALTRADVLAHHRAWFRPDNAILAVAGDVDPQKVLLDVRKRFAEWSAPPVQKPVLAKPAVGKGGRLVQRVDTNQLNFALGHLSVDRHDPDYFALRVLEHVFCRSTGFADRLSKVIRDEHGWAYEVWGVLTQQADQEAGPFLIYIGTAAENGWKPHEETLKILADLRENGPTEAEIARAKNFLLRSQPFARQTSDQLASTMITLRRLNLGIDYGARYARRIKAVTREDLLRVAREHLRPEALTTVVVGPVDKEGQVIPPDDGERK